MTDPKTWQSHACGFYFYTDLKIMAKIWEVPLHARKLQTKLSAFQDRGVPKPTSEMSTRAPAQMGRREAEREGGK